VRGFTHEPGAGGSPEWFTPPEIFTALDLAFDTDPCAPAPHLAPWIPASLRYSLPVDGLAQPWYGRVWLNPPYGTETGRWVGRLADHGNGIAFTFTRADTPWWQSAVARADLVCFVAGRVEFIPGDLEFRRRSRSGAPSCLIAFGEDNALAVLESGLGTCLVASAEAVRAQAELWA
jgi:hypothetical protein